MFSNVLTFCVGGFLIIQQKKSRIKEERNLRTEKMRKLSIESSKAKLVAFSDRWKHWLQGKQLKVDLQYWQSFGSF